MKLSPLSSLALPLVAATTLGFGESTIDSSQPYAYSANSGWVNAHAEGPNGVVVSETFLAGYAYGANFGWIHVGDGNPANGHTYANTDGSDSGVNRDASGNLSGLAYSANIGWLNFDWASPGDPNRPRISWSGDFFGYAYSANAGWIALGSGWGLVTDTFAQQDTDNDSMADPWELRYFGDLGTAGVGTDADGDGQSDAAEATAGTDPTDNQSYLRIVSHTYNSGVTQVTITFTSNPARLYQIERNPTLPGTWVDSGLNIITPDSGPTTTRTFSFPASTAQFFRVIALNSFAP